MSSSPSPEATARRSPAEPPPAMPLDVLAPTVSTAVPETSEDLSTPLALLLLAAPSLVAPPASRALVSIATVSAPLVFVATDAVSATVLSGSALALLATTRTTAPPTTSAPLVSTSAWERLFLAPKTTTAALRPSAFLREAAHRLRSQVAATRLLLPRPVSLLPHRLQFLHRLPFLLPRTCPSPPRTSASRDPPRVSRSPSLPSSWPSWLSSSERLLEFLFLLIHAFSSSSSLSSLFVSCLCPLDAS